MVDRDASLAREISAVHGLRPTRITAVTGQGSVNKVFVVESEGSRTVVRFAADPLRGDDVDVEAWCLAQAAGHGIPSPRVLGEGRHHGVPYLVLEYVAGTPGTRLRSLEAWRRLGEYARIIHSVPVTAKAPAGLFSRFGRDLPAAWQAHLRYNLDELVDTDPLLALGVYPRERQAHLRRVVARLRRVDLAFGLSHGDLSPRNLLVPSEGPPVLLDWGSASAGPSPYGDLLPVYETHRAAGDPSARELGAFAAGMGADLDELSETLEDVSVLSSLDLVRWAIDRRPDRLDEIVGSTRSHLAQI